MTGFQSCATRALALVDRNMLPCYHHPCCDTAAWNFMRFVGGVCLLSCCGDNPQHHKNGWLATTRCIPWLSRNNLSGLNVSWLLTTRTDDHKNEIQSNNDQKNLALQKKFCWYSKNEHEKNEEILSDEYSSLMKWDVDELFLAEWDDYGWYRYMGRVAWGCLLFHGLLVRTLSFLILLDPELKAAFNLISHWTFLWFQNVTLHRILWLFHFKSIFLQSCAFIMTFSIL